MQAKRAKKIRVFFEGEKTFPIAQKALKTFEGIFKLPAGEAMPLFNGISPQDIDKSAESLVKMRITNPFSMENGRSGSVTPVEKNYEMRRIKQSSAPAYGVPYDGFEFAGFLNLRVMGRKIFKDLLPVVITDQLLMTFDENDLRYHARYLILSVPCIISLGGLVEGPAKPRAYYFERAELSSAFQPEVADAFVRKNYEGKFLTHGDPRMHLVVAGCLLQCAFYTALGEGFCENPTCRLHNFHFQEQLINAHASEAVNLCERHKALLKKLREVVQ